MGELTPILAALRRIHTISSRNHGVNIYMHQQMSPETQTMEMNVELHVRSSLKTIRSTLIVKLYKIKLTILASSYCKSTNHDSTIIFNNRFHFRKYALTEF